MAKPSTKPVDAAALEKPADESTKPAPVHAPLGRLAMKARIAELEKENAELRAKRG